MKISSASSKTSAYCLTVWEWFFNPQLLHTIACFLNCRTCKEQCSKAELGWSHRSITSPVLSCRGCYHGLPLSVAIQCVFRDEWKTILGQVSNCINYSTIRFYEGYYQPFSRSSCGSWLPSRPWLPCTYNDRGCVMVGGPNWKLSSLSPRSPQRPTWTLFLGQASIVAISEGELY